MSESQIVSAAEASIAALTDALAQAEARALKAESDARELRALLAKLKTSLAEQSNDPMTDGVMGGGAA